MPGAKADVSGAQPARRTGERMLSYPSLKRKVAQGTFESLIASNVPLQQREPTTLPT